MIRILLISLIISITSQLAAQNLVLTYNEEDVSNSEFTVEGVPTDNLIKTVIYITNKAEEAVNIKVKRTGSEVVEGTYNSFCLGSCYPPTTDEAENPLTIEAGATTSKDDFYLEFYPENFEGESTISFEIWDIDDTENKVTFTVTFSIHTPTGISASAKFTALTAYPNPMTSNDLKINYSLQPELANVKVTVRNILGMLVAQKEITNKSGAIDFNLINLPNGLYLYSIESGGKKIITKKLMINR